MCFNSKLVTSLIFLLYTQASAQVPMCINGNIEGNDKLLKSYESSRDPLRVAFVNSRKINPTQTAKGDLCLPSDASKKNLSALSSVSSHIQSSGPKSPKIKRECIQAAMTRSPGNDGYICNYPTNKEAKRGFSNKTQSVPWAYGTAGGRSLQCVNNDMVDYVTFAVNNAIQCMTPESLIDSRVIYKKLNNETGFNSSLAARGGVGIGQLTTPAIKELADENLGKGRYILENIAQSTKPECRAFKHIAEKDLQSRPRVQNTCDWVSPGDGLARNLIYSVGYYLVMRDQYVIPALSKRSPALTSNASLVSDFTAIAYGAEGLDHVKWLMQKHRVGKNTKATVLQGKIRKDSVYLTNIKGKMKEITCIRKGKDPTSKECLDDKISNADLEADSCVVK